MTRVTRSTSSTYGTVSIVDNNWFQARRHGRPFAGHSLTSPQTGQDARSVT